MVPHKTVRGAIALGRLAVSLLPTYTPNITIISYTTKYTYYHTIIQAFEGIPEPYDKKKRVVVPAALKVLRMRPDRKFCVLGELAKEVGWGYTDLVKRLETQRKIKEQAYYAEKKVIISKKSKAESSADLSKVTPILAEHGY